MSSSRKLIVQFTVYLPITLIRDGKLIKENLIEINRDSLWLRNQLFAIGIRKIEDVLFAE